MYILSGGVFGLLTGGVLGLLTGGVVGVLTQEVNSISKHVTIIINLFIILFVLRKNL